MEHAAAIAPQNQITPTTQPERWRDTTKSMLSITVAIPCLNEALTIQKVIEDFRRELPEATLIVCDNGSEDETPAKARAAGARVLREPRRGKGWAVQTILREANTDVLVIVDGDDTYPANAVRELIAPIVAGEADMVVGNRLVPEGHSAFPTLHVFGNRLIVWTLNTCFGTAFRDVLSGYRAFSRRVVHDVPLITPGFETETELTIQVLVRGLVVKEVPILYRARPGNSVSKLRTFRDGYRILLTMIVLMRDHRPLVVFSLLACVTFLFGAIVGAGAAPSYFAGRAGAALLIVIALLAGLAALGLFLTGLVLNAVNTRFRELSVLLQRRRRHDA